MELEVALSVTLLGILCVAVIPMVVYSIRQFCRHSHLPPFERRRPRFLMTVALGFLGILFIERPIFMLQSVGVFGSGQPAQLIRLTTTFVFINGSLYLCLVTIILIHFDLNYASFLLVKIWMVHLQPSIAESNFYAKHRNTLGNWKFLVAISALYWVIVFAARLTMHFLDPENTLAIGIAYSVSFIPILAVGIWCVVQTKDVSDVLQIHSQLKLLARVAGVALFVHISIEIGTRLFAPPPVQDFLFSLNVFAYCTGFLFALLVQPIRAFTKHFSADRPNSLSLLDTKLCQTDAVEYVRHFLSKPKRFEAFMVYCVKEMSHANFLFATEVIQYKTNVQRLMNVMGLEGVFYNYLDLPSTVPMSFIVSQHEYDPAAAATQIYEKYFQHANDLCVEVDHECRVQLALFFSAMTAGTIQAGLDTLESVFDDALMNVFELLARSAQLFASIPRSERLGSVWDVDVDKSQ